MSTDALQPAAPGRSAALDLFKSLLVVGMIAAHVVQLLSLSLPVWTNSFSEFINLLTFSGFLFAFGLGVGLAPIRRPRSWPQRLRPALLLLAASFISSFAFALLVDRTPLSIGLVLDVVTLRRLFGWSEFLATFFVLYLLLALARAPLVRIATTPLPLVCTIAACFLTTLLVVDWGWPASAAVLGTTRFASFPLPPYLPWFLVGIAIGRDRGRIRPWYWPAALGVTLLFYWTSAQSGTPQRFPPSVLWIAGPATWLLLYWSAARMIAERVPVPALFLVPGRHVLSFLLCSNLAIFATRHLLGKPVRAVALWLMVTAAILIVLTLAWLLVERRGARQTPLPAGSPLL